MSGGSYQYMYSYMQDMQEGDLHLFQVYCGQFIEDLQEAQKQLTEPFDPNQYPRRDEPYVSPNTIAAVSETLEDVKAAKVLMERLREKLQLLVDVAKAVEWHRSGDWGVDAVGEACVAYVGKTSTPPQARETSPAEASAISILEGVRIIQALNPRASLIGLDKCVCCNGPDPKSPKLDAKTQQKLLNLGWQWDAEQGAWSYYTGH